MVSIARPGTADMQRNMKASRTSSSSEKSGAAAARAIDVEALHRRFVAREATIGVIGFGVAIGKFVQLANPVLFEQFTLVLKDLGAVIGYYVVKHYLKVGKPA